jgi:hypothetical protein
MSQLVKTKRHANFKGFKPLRDSSNKKTLYSTRSCVNWAFFGTRGQSAKKGPIDTQTRQINYYFIVKSVKKNIKTLKENFTKIRNQVTSASGQLECLIVL